MDSSDSDRCLICLKMISCDPPICSTSSPSDPYRSQTSARDFKTFLTLVSRYLSINLTAVNHAMTLNHKNESIELNKRTADENNVCERCHPMLASFSVLYDQWICLKLDIDQCLKEVSQRIQDAAKEMDEFTVSGAAGAFQQDKMTAMKCANENLRDTFLKLVNRESGQDLPQLTRSRSDTVKTSHFHNDNHEEPFAAVIKAEDVNYFNDCPEDDEFISRYSVLHNQSEAEDCSGNGEAMDTEELVEPYPFDVIYRSSTNNGQEVRIQGQLLSPQKLGAESRGKRRMMIYSCVMCSKILSSGKGLKDHLLRHIRERPYFCNFCDKCYKDRQTLRHHLLSAHVKSNPALIPSAKKVCKEGGKEFHSEMKLRLHLQTHTKPVRCPECDKYFASQHSLNKHKRRFHSPPQKQFSNSNRSTIPHAFQCSECSKECGDRWKLARHMRTHTRQKSFKCSTCEKCFARQESLSLHEKVDHLYTDSFENAETTLVGSNDEVTNANIPNSCESIEVRRKRDACLFCSKSVESSFMEIHLRTHTEEKPYFCSMCDLSFSRSRNLKWHEMQHQNIKPFQCSICSKGFVRKDKLKSHIFTHSGEKPFLCGCGARFTRRENLRDHLKHVHKLDGRQPVCGICGQQFQDLLYCQLHEQTCKNSGLGGQPAFIMPEKTQEIMSFQCSECSKQFGHKYKLKRHLRTHFKNHKCAVCGKCFSESRQLIEHDKRCHSADASSFSQNASLPRDASTDQLQEICPECGKLFRSRAALGMHMKTHGPENNEKPLMCDLCGKCFVRRRSLKKHYAKFHPTEEIFPTILKF